MGIFWWPCEKAFWFFSSSFGANPSFLGDETMHLFTLEVIFERPKLLESWFLQHQGCGRYDPSHSCQCNDYCKAHGDCCSDYATTCGSALFGDLFMALLLKSTATSNSQLNILFCDRFSSLPSIKVMKMQRNACVLTGPRSRGGAAGGSCKVYGCGRFNYTHSCQCNLTFWVILLSIFQHF